MPKAAKTLKLLGPRRICNTKIHIRYHNSEY
jgi:ribosomal protein L30/L7E